MLTELSQRLLAWYDHNARRLPWRGRVDSYAVWVSEIMLQQTQVDTVIPYYKRWMARFPTIRDLAEAPEQAVLQVWEGLGYYSRARNLQRAAGQVMVEYAGELPRTRRELQTLPGIGPYSAAAIASIAYNQDEAALDGNIRRVYARVYAMRLPARSKEGEARLAEYARQNLPPGRAGDFNQALMDLGATICTPRGPRCLLCPLVGTCQAQAQGLQEQLPVMAARPNIPHLTVTAAVIQRGGRVLIAQRPIKGLLGGLWEFPGGKLEDGENLVGCLKREIREELTAEIEVGEPYGVYQHAYTHFKVTLYGFLCQLVSGEPAPIEAAAIAWVKPEEMTEYPMGKIDRQIARRLAKDGRVYDAEGGA
jgi:A/G-specific adenine glycosylase